MHIKICGLTTLEQALAAIEAGADMLGFNFYPPSPRFITPAACARIMREMRKQGYAPLTVGVFVNTPPAQIRAILDQCQLDLAQLAGDEPPQDLRDLGDAAFKAVRPASQDEAMQALADYGRSIPPALLLDARVPGSYGGSGVLANWEIAHHLARQAPILLAGGLTPANVGAAIRAVQPWGVDAASGVESSPGVKDRALMTAFVRAARAAS